MTAQEMWKFYSRKYDVDAEYEAWAFGDDPDRLAELVLNGVKTATSSGYVWYALEEEPIPEAGEYSVILDSCDQAVCIIRNTRAYVTPFEEVGPEHAWKEGEGDRSLDYWREVHESFFRSELEASGMTFDKTMKIVCEEFEKVYP